MKLPRLVALLLAAGFLVNLPLPAKFDGEAVNRNAKPFTSDLPNVDKIEVYQLDTDAEGHVRGVTATHVVEGAACQTLASLWRKQTYDWHFAAACFGPAYAVLFWHQGKLMVEGQICFDCSQIVFTKEITRGDIRNGVAYQGFDVHTPQSHQLHKLLANLFVSKTSK
jgi:hypothetical protein